jgi:deoxyribodipyrimidine photo-lyase
MFPLIHWFRRDLRLFDNTALAAAANDASGAVVPVFIFDKQLLNGRFASPARNAFLRDSLQALDEALQAQGSRLIMRVGDPLEELLALARAYSASGVYWNRDYSPYAISRDKAVKAALKEAGLEAKSFKDAVIFEMNEVATNDNRPYTVYTPYSRRWRARLAETGYELQDEPTLVGGDFLIDPSIEGKNRASPVPTEVVGEGKAPLAAGEAAGRAQLRAFVDGRRSFNIAGYAEGRNLLAQPATSRLSAHLRLGTVSIRECLRLAQEAGTDNDMQTGIDTWVGELIWRDFYVQVLYHHPHVLRGAFKREFDGLQWENDQTLFAAWCEGRTGYPIVDAAMRQLAAESWMHNRGRMITASFLTKDLLIDWRWGERFFMQHLVDGDPAANNGGWQWAAGTGTDAQPYFRIFNPTSQGQKFDPGGAYVRRYIPELANVPDSFIHEPWKMSAELQRRSGVQIGRDYPAPIVDHGTQRQRALDLYGKVKRSS